MSNEIYFSNDGETVYCNHNDFSVSDFSTENSAYGGLRRVFVTLDDRITGDSYPMVSTSFQTMERKLNSKMQSLIKEHTKSNGKNIAEQRNIGAKNNQEFLSNPLSKLISEVKNKSIKSHLRSDEFDEDYPVKPKIEKFRSKPSKPFKFKYKPKIDVFDIILGIKNIKIKKARKLYRQALKHYDDEILRYNQELKKHSDFEQMALIKYKKDVNSYKIKKEEFEKSKKKENEELLALENLNSNSSDEKKEKYFSLFLGGIVIDEWLSIHPEFFCENGTLILNMELPSNEVLPKLKNVSYIQSRDEFKESFISKSQEISNYNNLIFSICLFYMKIVVVQNKNNLVSNVAVNGFVEGRNNATGKFERKCIVSVISECNIISEIDFNHVDPKSCFKSLKGLHSNNLLDEIPVKPVIQTSKADKRFIDAEDNLENLDPSSNLAAMDWQEFEHLVREVFEKEFSKDGGEVKVTQSSRDGGVDAIAFDPDPIKGGKIVIQAKRYTNVVGVSSVRDLYGTVINEGANRGVLITTSDFGPDSHNFVKDKPISLLNGQNLLYLLKKHGYIAKIDIKEAKKIIKEKGY